MNKLVICNKSGVSSSCIRCEHSILLLHSPISINPQWDTSTTCRKMDDCSLYIAGEYKEIRVKCKELK